MHDKKGDLSMLVINLTLMHLKTVPLFCPLRDRSPILILIVLSLQTIGDLFQGFIFLESGKTKVVEEDFHEKPKSQPFGLNVQTITVPGIAPNLQDF